MSTPREIKDLLKGRQPARIGQVDVTSPQALEARVEGLADAVEALSQVGGSGVVAPFAANTAYKANQPITQGGRTYLAKADFTSGALFSAGDWNRLPITVDLADLGFDPGTQAELDAAQATLAGQIATRAPRLTRTAVKTAAYTAVDGDLVPVDVSAAGLTVTLPSAGAARVAVKIVAAPAGNVATIAVAGTDRLNVAGGVLSFTLSLLNQGAVLERDSATGVWTVASTDIPLSQLDVRFPNRGRVAYSTVAADQAPDFVRVGTPGVPMLQPSDIGDGEGLYWPWVVNARAVLGNAALDTYYLYCSTDHAVGDGAIRLLTGPTPVGPWTSRGTVYADTVSGRQTETPSVLIRPEDPAGKPFYLFYHNVSNGLVAPLGGQQNTVVARSADGRTNWERLGKVVEPLNRQESNADGHNGYFRPWRVGQGWIAYSLWGGTTVNSGLAVHASDDGLVLYTDPRIIRHPMVLPDSLDQSHAPQNYWSPFQWLGRWWAAGFYGNPASNLGVTASQVFIAPLSADFRRLIGRPKLILPPTGQETTNIRACHVFAEGGDLYLYWQCDSKFFCAKAGA